MAKRKERAGRVKVRATDIGYYGERSRTIGDVFTISDEELKDEEGKVKRGADGKPVLKEFSKNWMEFTDEEPTETPMILEDDEDYDPDHNARTSAPHRVGDSEVVGPGIPDGGEREVDGDPEPLPTSTPVKPNDTNQKAPTAKKGTSNKDVI